MEKKITFIESLAQALVKLNFFSEVEAEQLATDFQGRAKGRVDEFLLDEGIVDRETLLKALQIVYQVPSFDVCGYFFNHQILNLFPQDFLMNNSVIPLDIEDDIMVVIMSNPADEATIEAIGRYVSYNIEVYVGIQRDIDDAIEQYADEDVITADVQEADQDVTESEMDCDSDIIDVN